MRDGITPRDKGVDVNPLPRQSVEGDLVSTGDEGPGGDVTLVGRQRAAQRQLEDGGAKVGVGLRLQEGGHADGLKPRRG